MANPVAGRQHFIIMGGANDGDSFFTVEFAEEIDDFFAGACVEVTGWFVGKDYGGGVGEGAGDCHALLLTA